MPAALALLVTIGFAAGAGVAVYISPIIEESSSYSTWVLGPHSNLITLSGTVEMIGEDFLVLREEDNTTRIHITYDAQTLSLALPEKEESGVVTGARLLVVPPQESLRTGALVRIVLRSTSETSTLYAALIMLIP